jgi:Flp pilus assembly protein TadG
MTRVFREARRDESGVVLIIVACAMVVLIGMSAIAIDASYGFVQNRRAQNASDFAAFAASQQLNGSVFCNGTSTPTMQQISAIVEAIVGANSPDAKTTWTGQFLDTNGAEIPSSVTNATFTSASTGYPPNHSCGVRITATPKWPPFFSGIFGVHQLGGYATAKVAPKATTLPNIGIVALNKYGPHEVLGGGTGSFVVSGDIFLNTQVNAQPWSGTYTDPTTNVSFDWDDAIDAKQGSNLYVYGTIHSQYGTNSAEQEWPLDHCFNPDVLGQVHADPAPTDEQQYNPGDPSAAGSNLPDRQMACDSTFGTTTYTVNVDFDNIDADATQIADPLTAVGSPPNPLASTDNTCPGAASTAVFGAIDPTTTTLMPGIYTQPVEITGPAGGGTVTFQDCPGGYTGVYEFQQGLWLNPQAGVTVNANDVVIATQAPYPLAGNVPGADTTPGDASTFVASGAGNGAPCLPAGTTASVPSGGESEVTTNPCGGTNPQEFGVVGYVDQDEQPDPTEYGTGNNFSLIIGGAVGSTVNLTGPTSGAYGGTQGNSGLVLYQDPNTEANYGFDAESGDGATIAINGVVYNASLPDYGAPAADGGTTPEDFWDGTGGGIPFYGGGTLQAGYGTGWSSGPAGSSGTVKLTGSAIVDNFNTDGDTGITIIGQPYTLPGASTLSLIG